MIQIDKELSKKIAETHYISCEPVVRGRVNFLIDLFNAIGNRKYINYTDDKEIRLKYGFSKIDSIRSLLSPISLSNIEYDDIKLMFSSGEISSFKVNKHYFQKACKFFKLISKDLENILKSDPEYLFLKYVRKWKKQINYKPLLENVFSYETLTGSGFNSNNGFVWNSYKLTNFLKIKVCPYCNKNWINTVYDENGNKVTNPQLDHFFPKNEYPILRLSFYNLIPSCETCNARIKKESFLPLNNFIHPYVESFDPECFLFPIAVDSESLFGVGENYRISLESELSCEKYSKAKANYDFFHLEQIYEEHGDIISEVFFKRIKYGLTRIEDLLSHEMFKGMSIEEAYRVVFSNYYDEKDFNKRPFSKLTKDTLRSLELI